MLVGVVVGPLRVGTGDERHQVRAHLRGGPENVLAGIGGKGLDDRGVGDDLPRRGSGDADVERGLEIRLIEAREHALGVSRLEL